MPRGCFFFSVLKNNLYVDSLKNYSKSKKAEQQVHFFKCTTKSNISKDSWKHESRRAGSSYTTNHTIIQKLQIYLTSTWFHLGSSVATLQDRKPSVPNAVLLLGCLFFFLLLSVIVHSLQSSHPYAHARMT